MRLYHRGAIIRGDTSTPQLALVFTGDEFADGGERIRQVLRKHQIKASFFLTGRFYRNPAFQNIIQELKKDGHYLGAHSDQHLLYCDWRKRDSLLVNREQFRADLLRNYTEMQRFKVRESQARFYLPPYEWYNNTIATWTKELGLELINYTPGTLSHADYTTPNDKVYRSSRLILQSIYDFEKKAPSGLNGFILLMHIGTDPARTDKLYLYLDELLDYLKKNNYQPIRINELLTA
ncbi:polysaccharide deacetylase family protein [Tellurirhabdus bombi]|uniref:polysaccharide deacetylase family protein n=1 Tax=Tellurirhabdus bombi TaxID=2907205 RepID=UPI001F3C1697|nr:polysaccharide deacetylase family protein [Tellurirhabdus bombi]